MSDGDILKLFQSGKQSERNYRQFDGEWYVLDESPEAIAEARQEELVEWLKGGMSVTVERFQEKIDHLTAENERLRRERDNFLELAKEWMAIGHEKSTKQVFEWESRLLAAIEGEKNDK